MSCSPAIIDPSSHLDPPRLAPGALPANCISAGSLGWGPLFTAVAATVSFGFLPILLWSRSLSRLAAGDAAVLRRLRREALGASEIHHRLDDFIDRVEIRSGVGAFGLFVAILVAFAFVAQLHPLAHPLHELVNSTFGYEPNTLRWVDGYYDRYWFGQASGFQRRFMLHRIWMFGLTFSYAAAGLRIIGHRRAVARAIRVLNRQFLAAGSQPPYFRRSSGFSTALTVVGCVAAGNFGIWWGIPLLITGLLQRNYVRGPRRALLASQFSGVASAIRLDIARRCTRSGCRAELRPDARFCARCGNPTNDAFAGTVG